MIYKQIKDDMITALKEKRMTEKNDLSFLLSQLKNRAITLRVEVDDLSDVECAAMIKKYIKSSEEEKEMYSKAGRDTSDIDNRINLVKAYLPKQMEESEIRDIINSMEDKSIPNIMKTFKTNYNGKVDMGLVNKIAREINN